MKMLYKYECKEINIWTNKYEQVMGDVYQPQSRYKSELCLANRCIRTYKSRLRVAERLSVLSSKKHISRGDIKVRDNVKILLFAI